MDAITLTAITREIREQAFVPEKQGGARGHGALAGEKGSEDSALGGRIQAVVQADEYTLALELFAQSKRHWLVLSAHPQYARLHFLTSKARRGLTADSGILLLMRKRLRGARLTRVFQVPWERVVFLVCDHPQHGMTSLVAEIMGKWSNILLLDEQGVILESLRRFDPQRNRQRVVRKGAPYIQPPPQRGKIPIDLVTPADLERFLNQSPASTPLWRLLVQHIAGLSPLAARELSYRATGDAHADISHPNTRAQALFDVLSWFRNLPLQGGWSPSVSLHPTEATPSAFAPYQLTHLGQLEHYDSISAAARRYYEAVVGADSYAGRRQQVHKLLAQARKKLVGRRISLGEQSVSEEQVNEWRSFGEWILAYAWQVQPGDAELIADTGEGLLHIPLDPQLSASENAQHYFSRYRKAKRAAARIPPLLAAVDRDLAYLNQLESDLRLADNAPQIEEIRQAILAMGLVATSPGKRRSSLPRSQPLRLQSDDGFTVIVGLNALQNEQVTWKLAQPEDFWLHAQRVPGAHVIIKTRGIEPPETTILQAAAWAAYQSQARHDTRVAVLVTQRRHLRRLKGGRPGQVRVLQARTVNVIPQKWEQGE